MTPDLDYGYIADAIHNLRENRKTAQLRALSNIVACAHLDRGSRDNQTLMDAREGLAILQIIEDEDLVIDEVAKLIDWYQTL